MSGLRRKAARYSIVGWILACTLAGLGTGLVRTHAISGNSLHIVNVVLNTNRVQVRTLSTSEVEIRLRDAKGRLKARTTRPIPATGIQDVQLYTASGSPALIRPGDSIVAQPEAGEPVVVNTTLIDAQPMADQDALAMRGPPEVELRIQIQMPDEVFWRNYTATTDSAGQAQLAGLGLRPGVHGFVAYEPVPRRAVLVAFHAPTVVATVGADTIEGVAWGRREVALTVEDEIGQTTAATRLLADGEGYFSVQMAERIAGYQVLAGQTIHVAWEDQAIHLNVPQLSVRPDPVNNRITGHGPAGTQLSVTVYDTAAARRWWYYPRTDAQGGFEIDLPEHVQLSPNDDGSVIFETAAGHKIVAEFRVPWLELQVGSHRVSGRGTPKASVDLTLEAADGTTKAMGDASVDSRGRFAVELQAKGEPVPVAAGDTVRLTVGADEIAVQLPRLSVQLDPEQELVAGHGPPGEELEVSLIIDSEQLADTAVPGADGGFRLDVGGRADIRAGALARVTYTTPAGHSVFAQKRLLQVTVQAGANYLTGVADPDATIDIILQDTDGQPKDQARTTPNPQGRFDVALASDCHTPISTAPGDIVILQTTTEDVSVTVPGLTAALDAATDRLVGTGPPGTAVEARLTSADGFPRRRDDIHIGNDGHFSLGYRPETDVQSGDYVTIWLTLAGGHLAFARATAPAFSVRIGGAVLSGAVAPLSAVEVVLLKDQDPVAARAASSSDRNGSFSVTLRATDGQAVSVASGDSVAITTDGGTYQHEVPPLSLTVDPAGPTLSGTTLPSSTMQFTFISSSRYYLQEPLSVGPDGRYSVMLDPDIAVKAGDWAQVSLRTSDGLRAVAVWRAPQFTAYAGTHYVELNTSLGEGARITLRSGDGELRATGHPDPNNADAYLFTSGGQPVVVQPDDRITLERTDAGEVAAMTVADLTAELVPASPSVTGAAPAGGQVFVLVTGTGGEDSRSGQVPVWTDGRYQQQFASPGLGAGSSARVSYQDPETGHVTVRETYRGWFQATLGENEVEVRADPLSAVQLRLSGPAGEAKGRAGPTRVDYRGTAILVLVDDTGEPTGVATADELELASSAGTTSLAIPEIVVGVEVADDSVFGVVDEGGSVRVTLSTPDGCTYERRAQPAGDGSFRVPFAPEVRIGPGADVGLRYTTVTGHALETSRTIRAAHLPLVSKR